MAMYTPTAVGIPSLTSDFSGICPFTGSRRRLLHTGQGDQAAQTEEVEPPRRERSGLHELSLCRIMMEVRHLSRSLVSSTLFRL